MCVHMRHVLCHVLSCVSVVSWCYVCLVLLSCVVVMCWPCVSHVLPCISHVFAMYQPCIRHVSCRSYTPLKLQRLGYVVRIDVANALALAAPVGRIWMETLSRALWLVLLPYLPRAGLVGLVVPPLWVACERIRPMPRTGLVGVVVPHL